MNPGEPEEYAVQGDPDEYRAEVERGLQEQAQTPEPAKEYQQGAVDARDCMSLLPVVAEKPALDEPPKSGTDPKQNRAIEIGEALLPAYQKASMLDVDPEAERLLRRMFPDDAVEQRQDGLLYIPHILIRERLTDAFGAGKWTMIRRREWIDNRNGKETLYAEWVMLVNGAAVGETVTDHMLTSRMSYGDALESTEGEAVRRIAAKRFMCGSQVWSPKYCRDWEAAQKAALKAAQTVRTPAPPSAPTQANKTPPAASQEAKPTESKPAAPHPETEAEKLQRWKKLLQPLNDFAVNWLRDNGKLLPTENLDDLTWIPANRKEAGDVLEAIHQIMDGLAPASGAVEEKPIDVKPNKDAEPWHEYEDEHGQIVRVPWRDLIVPRGKNRGAKFVDLPKEDLWWWCVKFEAKPWTGKDGKERPPSKDDVYLRRTLDKVKIHYGFK